MQVLRMCDSDYIRSLEACIQSGKTVKIKILIKKIFRKLFSKVILENISEELDPILDAVLMKQTFKQGTVTSVKIGDSVIEYNPNFKYKKANSCNEIASV